MPTKTKITRSVALSLVLVASAYGCGGPTAGAPAPALAEAKQSTPEGARVYAAECASCHGENGEGLQAAPPVMGGGALARQGGHRGEFKSAKDVFEYVKANMPLPKNKAGSLSDDQYWAVTTYMAVASGKQVPEGGLNAENAASVTINP